ncbi:hypothetical protein SDC9_146651 [bioreactor metagenome]|uniref:Helix-turn-helix domain-containing protein n=1 Tax=bioreactor metagenome TaxID=1076179 RepID=A0A645EC88_9ZZZZ
MEKVKSLNLLTVQEASKLASVSKSHLYHASVAKNLTSIRIGGLLRFSKIDLGMIEDDEVHQDFLMTVKEVSKLLKVSTCWVYENSELLKIAEVKHGRAKRYSALKLLKIINQSREERRSNNAIEESSWDQTKGRRIIFPGCPGYSKVS